jgi:hypothetical protein
VKEAVLRAFFEGRVDAMTLSEDIAGTVEPEGKTSHYRIEDLDEEFEVRAEHLVRLCDSVLDGDLDPKHLETIGFCLVASDAFQWDTEVVDGEVIAETLSDWSEPRINYPLTQENVTKFRERLLTGENLFKEPNIAA